MLNPAVENKGGTLRPPLNPKGDKPPATKEDKKDGNENKKDGDAEENETTSAAYVQALPPPDLFDIACNLLMQLATDEISKAKAVDEMAEALDIIDNVSMRDFRRKVAHLVVQLGRLRAQIDAFSRDILPQAERRHADNPER